MSWRHVKSAKNKKTYLFERDDNFLSVGVVSEMLSQNFEEFFVEIQTTFFLWRF